MANIPVWRLEAIGGPENAPAAFDRLSVLMGQLANGRDCYGMARREEGVLRYWACFGRKSTDPELRGAEAAKIPAGIYLITQISSWQQRIPEIGGLFDELATHCQPDPNGYAIEYYRGNVMELWLGVK
jgi:hypothetical protein